MKKILVPIDFSDVTDHILDNAGELANALNAELLIIHVTVPVSKSIKDKIEYQTLPSIGELGTGYTAAIKYDVIRDQIAHELKKEHSQLLEIKSDLIKKGVNARAILIEGDTVLSILKEAEEINADFVVIGSHGHGAWHKALLGSVANAVLKDIKCPLIIIPSPKK
jgi:nucleotide-binding universal stress UspA family protein